MAAKSSHNNQSSYPIGTKKKPKKTMLFVFPAYRCYMCNMARIGFMASEEMSFENVDDRQRTDDDDGRTKDACLYYKLTYEPLAQVS